MKIITVNVNGIRAAAKKGFFDWLPKQDADVVCIQETKAQQSQLTDPIFRPGAYHCYYHDAEKKGYSGVALYSKRQPKNLKFGIGLDYVDKEGRYLEADFGDLKVVSLYMQSGSSSEARQALKFRFMDDFLPHLRKIAKAKENWVLCGDWNIAHKAIDLKNWRSNQKNSGFLAEERAWMDTLFDEVGLCDAFRQVNPDAEQYTWWSNRGRAWDNNVGWRIDYQITTPGLQARVKTVEIYKQQRFSDHAPLTVCYEI
ncbi:exodeoxyribonuclease III [Candidatus Venteria ishoeyi]|uniref:exodeoxyribonuclease III n=1 Tax=Candidatus Venteria ishoeyi TaxID=1899563 RepID=UPI0025A5F56B|nr:exodeoxyribonuclease III [Candidatus Venteria ishoeyi]MDM8546505.1 exodeoxyribonuclease III [Candidatus Venteria ishoeyi]